ncbi:MAG: IS200/IS605 family transposase [Bacteroidales bacterium]
MANTYTKIHLHFVFGVLSRDRILPPEGSEEVRRYITGIVQNRKHKMLCINNVPDHVHMLVGFNPSDSPSNLMREVKANSAKFIKEQSWMKFRFQWQEGYGAFSVGYSQIAAKCKYIEDQQEHHRRISFAEEYEMLLRKYDIAFNRKYIFK